MKPLLSSARRVARLAVCLLVIGVGDRDLAAWTAEPVIWFDRPATTWNEALPLGHGRLGAMVFGGVPTGVLLPSHERAATSRWTSSGRMAR